MTMTMTMTMTKRMTIRLKRVCRFLAGDGNRYCGRYMAASSSTVRLLSIVMTIIGGIDKRDLAADADDEYQKLMTDDHF